MKFYSLNWVQLSYDFGKMIPSGTAQGYFCPNRWIMIFIFFSLFFLLFELYLILISFGIKFWLVHIYMVYNDAIEVKQLRIYEYLILVTLFK
jgi:hypothetical protein